jgi:hypothetical protein
MLVLADRNFLLLRDGQDQVAFGTDATATNLTRPLDAPSDGWQRMSASGLPPGSAASG